MSFLIKYQRDVFNHERPVWGLNLRWRLLHSTHSSSFQRKMQIGPETRRILLTYFPRMRSQRKYFLMWSATKRNCEKWGHIPKEFPKCFNKTKQDWTKSVPRFNILSERNKPSKVLMQEVNEATAQTNDFSAF